MTSEVVFVVVLTAVVDHCIFSGIIIK